MKKIFLHRRHSSLKGLKVALLCCLSKFFGDLSVSIVKTIVMIGECTYNLEFVGFGFKKSDGDKIESKN